MVRGVPRMCMRTTAHALSAATCAISSSPCNAVTSLMISAPAATAARATDAFEVSMLIAAPVFAASPSMTGSTRRNSSSAVTGAAPGRVDSPPISRISAPSSTRRSPWSTAALAAVKFPPSENESGVTLITPMITPRFARSNVRRPVFQIIRAGCAPNVRGPRVPRPGQTRRRWGPIWPANDGRVRPSSCGAGIGRR